MKNESNMQGGFWPVGPGGLIKGGTSEAKLAVVTVSLYGPTSEAADWPVRHLTAEERTSEEGEKKRSCCSNSAARQCFSARTVGDNLRVMAAVRGGAGAEGGVGWGGGNSTKQLRAEPSTLGFHWLQVQLGLSAASGLGYSQSQNSHLGPIGGEIKSQPGDSPP